VLASTQGRSAAEAAAMFAATAQYAREVIHAFNDQGFAALDPTGPKMERGPTS
jgi:transposase